MRSWWRSSTWARSAPRTRSRRDCKRIVRNVCLARLRRRTPALVSVEHLSDENVVNAGRSTEETLETQLLGDWIWAALVQLPEHLRLVVMLRYFGRQHPYAQIAAVLDAPVGTVRSRLSEAKRRLGGILLHSAADDWEHRRRAAAERHRIEHAVAELTRHRPEPFTAEVSRDVRVAFPTGRCCVAATSWPRWSRTISRRGSLSVSRTWCTVPASPSSRASSTTPPTIPRTVRQR
ncbi:MAG: sigma-70 family RNA polymerase sigma factor [Actinobacteria bacterium]|nr:sigma-70 family RNA polymerase sigma factor [Actinomycetota bacterium]